MKKVVVMPAFRRPEIAALSLEKLALACSLDTDVRIYLDTCGDERLEEFQYVRDTYFPTATIYRAGLHVIAPSGSWNILNSLAQGFDTKADLVFFIEEDVLVSRNFFKWHEARHSEYPYFVTSGRKLKNRDTSYYSNPGSCFSKEALSLIVPHICLEYFADQAGYLDKHFPGMDDAGILDDGLIRRVMRSVQGKAIAADPAIAFHYGFRYYNRLEPWMISGSIQNRIIEARKIFEKVNPNDRYSQDFEPFLEADDVD